MLECSSTPSLYHYTHYKTKHLILTCYHRVNPGAAELIWSHGMAHGSLPSPHLQELRLHCQVQATNKHQQLVKTHQVCGCQSMAKSHKCLSPSELSSQHLALRVWMHISLRHSVTADGDTVQWITRMQRCGLPRRWVCTMCLCTEV